MMNDESVTVEKERFSLVNNQARFFITRSDADEIWNVCLLFSSQEGERWTITKVITSLEFFLLSSLSLYLSYFCIHF
jgi:hypothetical protein